MISRKYLEVELRNCDRQKSLTLSRKGMKRMVSRKLTWVFPKIWVFPPNHPMFNRVYYYKPSILRCFPPIFGNIHLGGGSFKHLKNFHPDPGRDEPILTHHIFQMGWFNHHPEVQQRVAETPANWPKPPQK